jgi:hypothetical protein
MAIIMSYNCFNCKEEGKPLHGFVVCDSCKKKLQLFTNETIEKHAKKFTKSACRKDIMSKLELLESVYLKKKIKLLDILSNLDK